MIARTEQLDRLKAASARGRAARRTEQVDAYARRPGDGAAAVEKGASCRRPKQARCRRAGTGTAGLRLSLALTLPPLAHCGLAPDECGGTRATGPSCGASPLQHLRVLRRELVPYLPSYGGYVQYGVGVVLTLIIGRAAINALQAYQERQRAAEARPNEERRTQIAADQALQRLAKQVCPGCERPVNLANPEANFCPHCGIGLYERCVSCNHRKSTFERFCYPAGRRTRPMQGESLALRADRVREDGSSIRYRTAMVSQCRLHGLARGSGDWAVRRNILRRRVPSCVASECCMSA